MYQYSIIRRVFPLFLLLVTLFIINILPTKGTIIESNPNYKIVRRGSNGNNINNDNGSSKSSIQTPNQDQGGGEGEETNEYDLIDDVGTDYSSYDDDTDDNDDDDYENSSSDIDWEEVTSTPKQQKSTSNKSKLNKALSSQTNSTKITTVMKIVQTYKTPITIALITFAFRREIYTILTYPTKDGRRRFRFPMPTPTPTGILKIILFIDLVRKMQSGSTIGGDSTTSRTSMISDLLKPSYRSAFVPPLEQHYTFEKLNTRHFRDGVAFQKAMVDFPYKGGSTSTISSSPWSPSSSSSSSFIPLGKKYLNGITSTSTSTTTKTTTIDLGNTTSTENNSNGTVIILEMKGLDTTINKMDMIRDQIEFLLYTHRNLMDQSQQEEEEEAITETTIESTTITTSSSSSSSTTPTPTPTPKSLEIIILLESPGGSASDYGLAASQIGRLTKEPGIQVTICVDKVAASGGYMMAVMSSPGQLFAAPFSIVGSIGVIGQALNVHDRLQKWGVKPLVFRGGKDKAPVGLVGEVTEEGIAKTQMFVDKTHSNFKRHVVTARPILEEDIDEIATGDIWLGYDAYDVGLVDRIITSDEYIGEKMRNNYTVLKLKKFERPKLPLFGSPLSSGLLRLMQPNSQLISDVCTELHHVLSRFSKILDDVLEPKALSPQARYDTNNGT